MLGEEANECLEKTQTSVLMNKKRFSYIRLKGNIITAKIEKLTMKLNLMSET